MALRSTRSQHQTPLPLLFYHIVGPASRHSPSESNFFTINSSFVPGEKFKVLMLERLISTGITASTSYFKEYGVSTVDLRNVVRYARNTFGNSSVHLPFAPSSIFFNLLTIALFITLTWSLLWGYAGFEYLFFISRSPQYLWKTLLSNCKPLSDTKDSDIPNLVPMFF